MKVGFIGYGNMAQAIAQGLTRAHAVDGNDIVACAAHFDKLERNIAAVGGTAMHTPQEVVAAADMVGRGNQTISGRGCTCSNGRSTRRRFEDARYRLPQGWDLGEIPDPVRWGGHRHPHPVHDSEHSDGRGPGGADL